MNYNNQSGSKPSTDGTRIHGWGGSTYPCIRGVFVDGLFLHRHPYELVEEVVRNAPDEEAEAQRYSMVIEWSDEDDAYIVSLPEWGDLVHTHGETYAEAVARGKELLEADHRSSGAGHAGAILPPAHVAKP